MLMALPACNQPKATQAEPPKVAPRGSEPVLHAVYADRLREDMRQLNEAASGQVWWQMYTGAPTVDMDRMVTTAEELADVAANRLPKDVTPNRLAPDQLQIYMNLCNRLHKQALVLKQEAGAMTWPAQATMNQIIDTCNTCHTLFRGADRKRRQAGTRQVRHRTIVAEAMSSDQTRRNTTGTLQASG